MSRAYKLNTTQVHILHVLLQGDGLTAKEIAAKVGVSQVDMGGSSRCGPDPDPTSLYNLGYVTPVEEEDGRTGRYAIRFYLTDAGIRAGNEFKSNNVKPAQIPPAILDPVVVAFRPTRSYGLEKYSGSDWTQLRGMLPVEYHATSLESLARRVENRRKMGAYAELKRQVCWICGCIEDVEEVSTSTKRGMLFCPECRERNDAYFN